MDFSKHLVQIYGTMYYVRDMNKAVKHYAKIGGKPVMESPAWTEFEFKGQKICLHIAEGKMKNLPGGIAIFHVKGINKLMESLNKEGYEFTSKPHQVYEDDHTVHAIDTDGNEISFYGTL